MMVDDENVKYNSIGRFLPRIARINTNDGSTGKDSFSTGSSVKRVDLAIQLSLI